MNAQSRVRPGRWRCRPESYWERNDLELDTLRTGPRAASSALLQDQRAMKQAPRCMRAASDTTAGQGKPPD